MRITLVGPTSPLRGGVVAHTEGARAALERRGHRVDVVPIQRVFPRWVVGSRAARPHRGIAPGALDAMAPRSWRAIADAISADVVVVQQWTPVLAPALAVLLAHARVDRRLIVCHNVDPHEVIPAARRLVRTLVARSDGVLFHSEHVAGSARRCGAEGRSTRVAPMPLLLRAGVKGRPPPELADVDDGAPLVVMAGHLRSYKGLKDLVRAWPAIAAGVPARLVVAGEPLGARRDLRSLERLADREHRVRPILRYLEDAELAWLLARADTVVLPYARASQSAVFPLAVRLAASVVVSDAGALVEQAGTASGRIRIVPSGDSGSLARTVVETLRMPGADRASRQERPDTLSFAEVAASWVPFAEAVESLAGAATPGDATSNSGRSAASLVPGSAYDEPPQEPWYDGRRFASPVPRHHNQ